MANHRKLLRAALAAMISTALAAPAAAQERTLADVHKKVKSRVTQEQREAAADRQKALRAKVRPAKRTSTRATTLGGATATAAASAASVGGLSTVSAWPDPSFITTPGGTPDYFGSPNWAFSPPLRKFVDRLPGLGPDGANGLGQYLSVAKPDTKTYPGSDYYEIALKEFEERMHSDLPNPTRLRGYVQLNKGTDASGQNTLEPDPQHYLGPTIVAQKGRPVRIKFTNLLPTGAGGNLFIPVDTTIMGAGEGPKKSDGAGGWLDCDPAVEDCVMFTQNRATLHLHGGRTPWISDGTPHQWTTPPNESTPYPDGASVSYVPDMPQPAPRSGELTFFYTNQQSARLMFYHDHAHGITRLNVYVGEAAGYVLQDQEEKDLVDGEIIPSTMIPLIIQDKTFVDASTVRLSDPTWNWGTGAKDQDGYVTPKTGDLWYPHVYSPAQNPYDEGGANPFGRWHYGPWFWPPTNNIKYPPVANPYYDPENAPWEPPEAPPTPNPSIPGESFMDTPLVNGTAFPYLEVRPMAYRFRILNAANDRFWNLQLYEADPEVVTTFAGRTEVRMVPAEVTPGFPDYWPVDGREGGVPDPATAGPEWVQIATEGGFLPAPAIFPSQPVAWNMDPTTFNFGNVSDHSLLLAPAERADVIVDFSKHAGKTFILYNDAPAAFPARDARLDYYTGSPDLTDTGGHPGTKAGFGPNTRTIMQIRVSNDAPAPEFDVGALQAAFRTTAIQRGTFARSQEAVPVAQPAYNETYGKAFPNRWPYWGVARIQDFSLSFHTLDPDASSTVTTSVVNSLPMKTKAIHDEMGAAFDMLYGRMSGKLGLQLPNAGANQQNWILQNYIDPTTEIVSAGETQIWKITHNGVDTHPIHFHLFDVQLLNRVGWDGAIRYPDANELGWKDTVRISPLEDTIVALRPIAPKQPFGVPDSWRVLNPADKVGSTADFSNLDPTTGQAFPIPVSNQLTNFGWEYVWHCHILTHEEDDMMRPVSMYVPSTIPDSPVVITSTVQGDGFSLAWSDGTPAHLATTWGNPENEVGYRIERAAGNGEFTPLARALANQTSYFDGDADTGLPYRYRVIAFNAAGEAQSNVASVNDDLLNPPVIGAAPPTITFPAQRVGTTSGPQQVVVSNTGAGALAVGPVTITGTNAADFARTTGCSIVAPDSSCTVDVSFRPTLGGVRTASLSIGSNDPASPIVTVALAGTATAPTVVVAPQALAFGAQRVGATSPSQLVTIANTGNAPFVLTGIAMTGTNFNEFGQTNTCGAPPATILAGTSCTVAVTFSPAGRNARSAVLSITHDAAETPAGVALSGTGVAPLMGVSPTTLTFPLQLVNTSSAVRTVVVSNTGNAPLTLGVVSLAGANVAEFTRTTSCGASLPAGGSCSVDLVFRPTGAGTRTVTLSVTGDDPLNATVTASIAGTGSALVVTPTSLTFGEQLQSTQSAYQSLTLTNTGASAFTLGVSRAGDTADFRTGTNCGATLEGGRSCTYSIAFFPQATGPRSATFSFTQGDVPAPTSVGVTGTGVLPVATVAPAPLTFFSVLGYPSLPRDVTVTNIGTAPLAVTGLTITGTHASRFQVVGDTCGAPVPVGGRCTVSVRDLASTTTSPASARLNVNVQYPARPKSVALWGYISTPAYTLSRTSIAFPVTAVGSPSTAVQVTVKNVGHVPFTIPAFDFGGAGAAAYSQTNTCGAPLLHDDTCVVHVTFTPDAVGTHPATMTVNADAPAPDKSVTLSGTGK